MTTQPELEYPGGPITGDTKATVDLMANDWNAEHDWARFREACEQAAVIDEWIDLGGVELGIRHVNPNRVRQLLTNQHGLTIAPRRYSAFWHRAAGPNGFLDADGWVINDDAGAGNAGKPLRRYRMRT